MKKILLAIVCGGLLAMPSMASAAKHKRPHASKHVKKHKRATAARTTMASAQPQPIAPAAQPQHTANAAPTDNAPIVQQVRDDEAPRR